MKTRDELETALSAAGWKLIGSPTRTAGGWKASIQRGNASMLATGSTESEVLEDLLRSARAKGGQ